MAKLTEIEKYILEFTMFRIKQMEPVQNYINGLEDKKKPKEDKGYYYSLKQE